MLQEFATVRAGTSFLVLVFESDGGIVRLHPFMGEGAARQFARDQAVRAAQVMGGQVSYTWMSPDLEQAIADQAAEAEGDDPTWHKVQDMAWSVEW